MASAITASRVNELAAIGDACRANSPTPEDVPAMAGATASTSVDNSIEKRVVVFMVIPIKVQVEKHRGGWSGWIAVVAVLVI
jgi:hypothetical protein